MGMHSQDLDLQQIKPHGPDPGWEGLVVPKVPSGFRRKKRRDVKQSTLVFTRRPHGANPSALGTHVAPESSDLNPVIDVSSESEDLDMVRRTFRSPSW